MTVEIEVLVEALNLTKNGSARLEDICRNAGTIAQVARNVVQRYSEEGFLQLEADSIVVEKKNRVQLAVYIIEIGADPKRVCDLLSWNEFEDISAEAFEASGFSVIKHFHFKWSNRRWEVDILALNRPLVIVVDCKHWHRGWRRSAIMKTVESQIKRTQALTEASAFLSGKMGILKWKKATFIPVILSLIPGPFKFYKNTPIVPVLQIRNFLNEIAAHTSSLTHFSRDFGPSINEYC